MIGVIGLGKVGAPLLQVLGEHFPVVGFDVDKKAGQDAATLCPDAVIVDTLTELAQKCSLVFIVTPTPELPGGGFNDNIIESVLFDLGTVWQGKQSESIAVVVSTLYPGSAEVLDLVFRQSAQDNPHVSMVYSPAFIRQGTVAQDFKRPDFLLFGTESGRVPGSVINTYLTMVEKPVSVIRSTFINAELGKLMLNMNLSLRVTVSNSIAALCEQIQGADANEVLKVVGADHRIGSAYMSPGAPFGGPCLPRDVRALVRLNADTFPGEFAKLYDMPLTIDQQNDLWRYTILGKVKAMIQKHKGALGIFGLGYKIDTSVMDEGLGLFLVNALSIADHQGGWIDSFAPDILTEHFKGFTRFLTLVSFLAESDMIVWTYNISPDIGDLDWSGKVVLDIWNVFPAKIQRVLKAYYPIGKGA